MKKTYSLQIVLLAGFALLSMGSLRKHEDVAAATHAQTAPISLQQKMEEEKDGVKGAPSPSMTFYPNGKFMTTPAVKDGAKPAPGDAPPEETAVENQKTAGFENVEEVQERAKTAVEDEDTWWSEGDDETFSTPKPSKQGE